MSTRAITEALDAVVDDALRARAAYELEAIEFACVPIELETKGSRMGFNGEVLP